MMTVPRSRTAALLVPLAVTLLFLFLVPSAVALDPPVVVSQGPIDKCAKLAKCGFSIATRMGAVTLNRQPGGQATATGSLEYDNAYAVTLNVGKLADRCNSKGTDDGLGAVLYLNLRMTNGDSWSKVPRPSKLLDLNGCSNGKVFRGFLTLKPEVAAPEDQERPGLAVHGQTEGQQRLLLVRR